jgi:hypothetical protein
LLRRSPARRNVPRQLKVTQRGWRKWGQGFRTALARGYFDCRVWSCHLYRPCSHNQVSALGWHFHFRDYRERDIITFNAVPSDS